MQYSFTIYAEPKACQRHRHTREGRRYAHPGSRNYQNLIKAMSEGHIGHPLTEQVEMKVKFWFKRPGKLRKTKPNPSYLRVGKSDDIDNLLKNVMDGLKSVAYIDDGQVVKVRAEKWVCGEDDLRPRIEIFLTDEIWGDSLKCPACAKPISQLNIINNHVMCGCGAKIKIKHRMPVQWQTEEVE